MGRRKIEIKYISDDRNRSVTFIKRKNGLFKKAHELSILTGAKVTVHVEDIKERHFDYKSANAGGAVADEAFDSDEEDEEDEGEDVAMGQQQTQQQMGQHQFMAVMQGVSMDADTSTQQQQQQQQQQIQGRPLQAITAQPARPGHRRTQSSTLHLSPNQPNSAISKARPNGHPYPRSPKVPSTPTMTASSSSTQQQTAHRPQSLDFTAYTGMHTVPAALSTPTSAATPGNHAHHAHRLSSASTVSQIDLAHAMGTPQTAPQATFNSNGQQVYFGRSPGLSDFDAVFPQDPPRPPIQQPRFPQGYPQQQQGNGHNAKLEDFEGFEYMEEDADPSMTQASTPAFYDYSANPSLTNLHAPPTGSGANAPGLGIVLEAGFDGDSPTTSEQQFHANRHQQQQLTMQQQAQMQGRAMHSAQLQQPYQGYRPSPGFNPHQQGSFYGNASGAMSTPNLSWFGSAR